MNYELLITDVYPPFYAMENSKVVAGKLKSNVPVSK